ncbi:MAG: 1-acyl-sn-glycerol-3-phosphate acyltransferase [Saprospiraceae bacterium]|nr:1-acyl-sn-glycerol-3-phosphate acyltransferase [Saprospiraceae bacterium]
MKLPLIEDLRNWPVFKLSEHRKSFVNEVIKDVESQYEQLGSMELDQALSKTIFQERQRVKSNPWKADPPNENIFFKKLLKEYNENKESSISFQKNKESVHRLIHRYVEEISGSFNIATFLFARRILTRFFYVLFYKLNFNLLLRTKNLQSKLAKRMVVNGEIDLVRKIFPNNTVILVPTHSSNLDSILVGYMADAFAGLPAFTYGAGLNLYDSEFFAFFMNRLGAYRVDRRKKSPIYLHTLSTYSRLVAEKGVNTIFFPGGTRSRSGQVETKLKLGLLNSVLLAQRNLLMRNEPRKIVIVPVVIGYESVLEARSLIFQHLKLTGQEKFIVRERTSSFNEYVKFIFGIARKESKVYLTFGTPMDVFGNRLNENCESLNHLGSLVQLKDYFIREGNFILDSQRESIYTKELADAIIAQYKRYNLILPSHLTAYCAFNHFKLTHPGIDDIALVQLPEEEFFIPLSQFKDIFTKTLKRLIDLHNENKVMLSDYLLGASFDNLIEESVKAVGAFHNKKILAIENGNLVSDDLFGLYFYYNKLVNLESEIIER